MNEYKWVGRKVDEPWLQQEIYRTLYTVILKARNDCAIHSTDRTTDDKNRGVYVSLKTSIILSTLSSYQTVVPNGNEMLIGKLNNFPIFLDPSKDDDSILVRDFNESGIIWVSGI